MKKQLSTSLSGYNAKISEILFFFNSCVTGLHYRVQINFCISVIGTVFIYSVLPQNEKKSVRNSYDL
jgi:hypothetical protein